MPTPGMADGSVPCHLLPSTPGLPPSSAGTAPGTQQHMATGMPQRPFSTTTDSSGGHVPSRRASLSAAVLSDALEMLQLQCRAAASASLQNYADSTPSPVLAESGTTSSYSSGRQLTTGGLAVGAGGMPGLTVAQQTAALHQALGGSSRTTAGIPPSDTSMAYTTGTSSSAAGKATKYMRMMSGERSSSQDNYQLFAQHMPASQLQQQHASTQPPIQTIPELPRAFHPTAQPPDSMAAPPSMRGLQLRLNAQETWSSVDTRSTPSKEDNQYVCCGQSCTTSHSM